MQPLLLRLDADAVRQRGPPAAAALVAGDDGPRGERVDAVDAHLPLVLLAPRLCRGVDNVVEALYELRAVAHEAARHA